MAEDFTSDRTFLTPAFELLIEGQPIGRRVMADIIDLSFVDDLAAINSFEFSIYDWDPEALEPVYSYPFDEFGRARVFWDSKDPVPNLLPGSKLTLRLGYRDEGDLLTIMEGEVVSVTTGFPSSGLPVAKIRALDAFQRDMQTQWVEGNYSGRTLEIIDALCASVGLNRDFSAVEEDGEIEEDTPVDGPLFDEVEKRAKDMGLAMVTTQIDGAPGLRLEPPAASTQASVASFQWGRSLVDFTPSLSSASQNWEVAGRGADINGAEGQTGISVVHTWDDVPIALDPEAFGRHIGDNLQAVFGRGREVIKPDGGTSEDEVRKAVVARFREMAETLITGSGNCVGLPELRAGALIDIDKVGLMYSGKYRITQATHSFGASGYTTSFAATKLVFL